MKLTGKYLAASDILRHAMRADEVNGTTIRRQSEEWGAACLDAGGWPGPIVKRTGSDGADPTAVAIVNRGEEAEEVWARIVVAVRQGKGGYWWVPVPGTIPVLPPDVFGLILDHGQDLDATDEIELFDGE